MKNVTKKLKSLTWVDLILWSAPVLILFLASCSPLHAQDSQAKPKTDTLKCLGLKANGLNCQSTFVMKSGFCRMHDPDRILCSATKADKTPCKMVVNQAGETCHIHAEKLTPEELAKFPNYQQADKQLGKNYRFSDSWCELASKK